jgi:putative ABC transport system permease protein
MFWNNVKIALRNLRKNKLFAVINIAGLALGMTIYVLGGLLAKYESTHDAFFANSDRTYTLGSIAAPELNVGVDKLNTVFSAIGPIVETDLSDIEAVARTLRREYLVTMGDSSYYQTILFADPAILEIFDFNYLTGAADALDSPSGIVITETTAIKYFGETDVAGKVITLDNQYDFYVSAVIEDVPQNSHFNSGSRHSCMLNASWESRCGAFNSCPAVS